MNFHFFLISSLLSCVTAFQFSNLSVPLKNEVYCFHFAWLGPLHEEGKEINCAAPEYKGVPCIKDKSKIVINLTMPAYADLWNNRENYTCQLPPGYSCMKYTFFINNEIKNITHYCGKMIENEVKVVKTGCFSQKKGAETVEACSCQSTLGDKMPCNSSIRILPVMWRIILPLILFLNLFKLN